MTRVGLALTIGLGLVLPWAPGCEEDTAPRQATGPDARVRTHAVVSGTPTPQGLAYLEHVAEVHARADRTDDAAARETLLRDALERSVPTDVPEAEILRLGLAVRLAREVRTSEDGGSARVRVLLEPLLEPEISLPLDRVSAEALIELGDAAAAMGDDALAAGSYARSIRLMSLLRQEIEP